MRIQSPPKSRRHAVDVEFENEGAQGCGERNCKSKAEGTEDGAADKLRAQCRTPTRR